jgi:GAF domain-containing protein
MNEGTLSLTLKRYRRLVEISQELTSTLDLDALLTHVAKVAKEISGAQEGFILLQDERRHKLSFHPASSDRLEDRGELLAVLEQTASGSIHPFDGPYIHCSFKGRACTCYRGADGNAQPVGRCAGSNKKPQ